jgi:signal transduction histidine kinase
MGDLQVTCVACRVIKGREGRRGGHERCSVTGQIYWFKYKTEYMQTVQRFHDTAPQSENTMKTAEPENEMPPDGEVDRRIRLDWAFTLASVKICLIYLIFGIIWIIFSDRIFLPLASRQEDLVLISSAKGIVYIIVTTVILFLLLRYYSRQLQETHEQLEEQSRELIKRRELIEQSGEKFRAQYENNPLAILTWQNKGDDFVLIGYNAEATKLSGGKIAGMIGSTATALCSARPEMRSNLWRTYTEKTVSTREVWSSDLFPGKYLRATTAFIPPDMVLVHIEDITEQKRAEEEIQLANRKLSLMTDITYQDIQNKVTALRAYVSISKSRTGENDLIPLFGREEAVLEAIHHIIEDTKEYQQMGVKKLRWNPVGDMIRMQAALVGGKPEGAVQIDLHGLEIWSDPLIERIFYNLIDNAVKHGKTITRIYFSCRETPDGLVLTCEDNGAGIPMEQKTRVFDRVVGENRFGLFFVHEFLSISGMAITETGEPGSGARFEITVPRRMYRFSSGQIPEKT